MRPAFYALEAGSWRDYVTILHPPYTLWHLSYVVIGAALSPTLYLDRLGGTLLAFLLAVGIGAHALDELRGRPLGTHIPSRVLVSAAAVSIGGAVVLGIIASAVIDARLLAFTIFGAFIIVAYNLELLGGRFHTDFWFAAAWGSFPMMTAYWVNAGNFTVGASIVAILCFLLTAYQRILSKKARAIRRGTSTGSATGKGRGVVVGQQEAMAAIAAPERALKVLNLMVVLLALGLLFLRL